jgi:hypothetical protein
VPPVGIIGVTERKEGRTLGAVMFLR